MSNFFKTLYSKCRFHGSGDAQVMLTDSEIYALVTIAAHDLGWDTEELGLTEVPLPSDNYYSINLDWFNALQLEKVGADDIINALDVCFHRQVDFALYIQNLSALHRRRVKYKRILATQPLPIMDQIGPRVLLEFGCSDITLLANWMVWRKWIYDIDNRSAQETGYLFEPLLASCIGGEPVGAKNSPVKRLDPAGVQTSKGRQVDCLVPSTKCVYEFKLRVTKAASGQGRFGEELSFAEESQAAGYKPVLLVLDPTGSDRLTELSDKYLACGGVVYHGEEAWRHMEDEAGETMSVFIERYIKPAIESVESVDITSPKTLSLHWMNDQVALSIAGQDYMIDRRK